MTDFRPVLLMIRFARPTLAEVPLADLSSWKRVLAAGDRPVLERRAALTAADGNHPGPADSSSRNPSMNCSMMSAPTRSTHQSPSTVGFKFSAALAA